MSRASWENAAVRENRRASKRTDHTTLSAMARFPRGAGLLAGLVVRHDNLGRPPGGPPYYAYPYKLAREAGKSPRTEAGDHPSQNAQALRRRHHADSPPSRRRRNDSYRQERQPRHTIADSHRPRRTISRRRDVS